ncbi:MAG: transketolase [Acidobacteria bacterium]|nr:transketolase [Acidobacteriota bacterium]
MVPSFDDIDLLAINTIRTLSMDAVQRANSGHPGTPMALAPVAWLLYSRYLRHNPADPLWPDRDRFVLSCGHASMLLYSTLYLSGYDLELDELRQFRQWGSRTPGHPEVRLTPGVETTAGPLGQGCAASLGMALAEAHLAARFNRPGHRIIDHMTWVLCSDGDLMEGISNEAASLAGHLGLGRLVWIWDNNHITIEGSTNLAFSEDVEGRFAALGWHVQRVDDVNDLARLAVAMEAARDERERPSFIAVRSHIAFGAPHAQDTAKAHGSPLGEDEIAAAKRAYGWPTEEPFFVPEEARQRGLRSVAAGKELQSAWLAEVSAWEGEHPQLASEWRRRLECGLPEGWADDLPSYAVGEKPATRAASGKALTAIAERLPELVGGSADLAPSCKTHLGMSGDVDAGAWGERNLHFGIREHAMGAMMNGMALHGGIRPYGATFLVFSDYMRPAIRLACLMELPVIYVYTHDSIGVGEDGPTHQPVEHVAALRLIPGLTVIRPGDGNEAAAAWKVAVEHWHGPVALVLTRQGLPVLPFSAELAGAGVARGGYVLAEASGGQPRVVLMASGSELQLAVAAKGELEESGTPTRVVSLPSWELFDLQDDAYRAEVLGTGVPRLAIEAGVTRGWRDYVGDRGAVIGIDHFGASAPASELMQRFGFTVENVVATARRLVK